MQQVQKLYKLIKSETERPYRAMSTERSIQRVDSRDALHTPKLRTIGYSSRGFTDQSACRVECRNRARQLYKNISMLFLFSVKDGKLSTGVNATFNASCYG